MHKIKIIGSRCELISPENKKLKFNEVYELVRYANNHNVLISNKNELPQFYQDLLKS